MSVKAIAEFKIIIEIFLYIFFFILLNKHLKILILLHIYANFIELLIENKLRGLFNWETCYDLSKKDS